MASIVLIQQLANRLENSTTTNENLFPLKLTTKIIDLLISINCGNNDTESDGKPPVFMYS